MKSLLSITTVFLLCTAVRADYMIPQLPQAMSTITAAVDATITGFDRKGYALIDVHSQLYGEKHPDRIKSVSLSCFGGICPKDLGLKPGRYVMLLHGDNLYEGGMAFPVKDGKVALNEWTQKWMGLKASVDAADIKAKLHAAVPQPPKPIRCKLAPPPVGMPKSAPAPATP